MLNHEKAQQVSRPRNIIGQVGPVGPTPRPIMEVAGMNTTPKIFVAERAKRSRAVANAAASMRLEGFEPRADAQAINARYVAGEISAAEQERQILALAGR